MTPFVTGPKVAGYLLEKEVNFLYGAIDSPKRPLAAIVGGAKVSTKLPVLQSLMKKCNKILIGGGMIFTFYKANGLKIGKSLVEDDQVQLARELQVEAAKIGCQLILPSDVVCGDKFAADAQTKTVSINDIPDGWIGMDIGPDSIAKFQDELKSCNTIVWNGPMGVFEFDAFNKGTFAIANTLAERTKGNAITIVGGGDSVAAIHDAGLADAVSHVSTGGGASLEVMEGLVLPGVAALDDK